MKPFFAASIGLSLLLFSGCTLFSENYKTQYGLTNPDYPVIPPTPTDETYPSGVGQEHIEEYDKKYHEKRVLPSPGPDITDQQANQ